MRGEDLRGPREPMPPADLGDRLLNGNGRDARQAFWYYVLFLYLLTMAVSMVFIMPMMMQNMFAGIQQGIAQSQGPGQDPAAAQAAVQAVMMAPLFLVDWLDWLLFSLFCYNFVSSMPRSSVSS